MKELYISPSLIIIQLESGDVITTSAGLDVDEGRDD